MWAARWCMLATSTRRRLPRDGGHGGVVGVAPSWGRRSDGLTAPLCGCPVGPVVCPFAGLLRSIDGPLGPSVGRLGVRDWHQGVAGILLRSFVGSLGVTDGLQGPSVGRLGDCDGNQGVGSAVVGYVVAADGWRGVAAKGLWVFSTRQLDERRTCSRSDIGARFLEVQERRHPGSARDHPLCVAQASSSCERASSRRWHSAVEDCCLHPGPEEAMAADDCPWIESKERVPMTNQSPKRGGRGLRTKRELLV